MAIPPAGTPVGLEIPAKDVARGSAFYKAVFNWTFAPSTLGLPANKLLTFEVPGGVFPIGGALRRVDELATTQGTKLYLYVEDMSAAIEMIERHGGKKASDVIAEGDKGLFQYFEDSDVYTDSDSVKTERNTLEIHRPLKGPRNSKARVYSRHAA